MHLTEEQISVVDQMAELFYQPADIADNIGVDADDFCAAIAAKTGNAYTAYKKGWLRADIALRKSIAKSADNGSNPAQQMMLSFQKKSKPDL